MRRATAILLIGVTLTVGLPLVSGLGVVDVSAAETLIVDQDGTAEYRSIQTAIDDASAGETVEIRPGTYAETIVVDKNITVTAPDGARLDGTDVENPDVGVTIGNDESYEARNVAPTVRGVTVTRYETGIQSRTHGDWVVDDVTVRTVQKDGILHSYTEGGNWTVRDSDIVSTGSDGISAAQSDGEWVVENTVIRRANEHGIDAGFTSADWTVRNVSVQNSTFSSVNAGNSDGDWLIEHSSFKRGIRGDHSSGDWKITRSIIIKNDSFNPPISVSNTLGEWHIHQSVINQTSDDTTATAIDAEDAIAEGVATGNWWGSPSGPDEDACIGNVDCSDSLITRPGDVGYNSADGGKSISTPTPTAQPTPDADSDADERGPQEGTQWNVTVTRVIDGDTIEVEFPNGDTETLRLLGVDTPETTLNSVSPSEFEEIPNTTDGRDHLFEWGQNATQFATQTLANTKITVETDEQADRRGFFGRLLVFAYTDTDTDTDSPSFNRQLLTQGYARFSESEFATQDEFESAETQAQQNKTGLWNYDSENTTEDSESESEFHSDSLAIVTIHEDATGDEFENLNDEYVIFENPTNTTVELTGWTVEDEAGARYEFPSGFSLQPTEIVTLRTGSGEDTDADLYWGFERPIWNNDGDTVTVTAADDTVVVDRSYPTETSEPPETDTSIDINRTVSSEEVLPGEQVTVTTEITRASGSVSTSTSYEPQVASATVQSVTVDGVSATPILSEATVTGSTVTVGDVGTDTTVTITEEFTVSEEFTVTHRITGDVTAGETTTEVDPVSVTTSAAPESETENPVIVGKPATDTDGDGQLEDVDGDGQANFDDGIALAFNTGAASVTENPDSFDFDSDGDVDFDDAIALVFQV